MKNKKDEKLVSATSHINYSDMSKTKEELVHELTAMRRKMAELEAGAAVDSDNSRGYEARILELFFKHTPTPLAIMDRNFNFIRVNEAYARADNLDVSAFKGRNHFEFYPSEAKAIFEEVVRTQKTFQAFSRPFIYEKNPERGVTYWDWVLSPVLDQDGEVELLIFALNNVTERVRAELEPQLNELRLEALLKLNYMNSASVEDIANYVMDEAVRLTGSGLGWVGLTNENEDGIEVQAWSQIDGKKHSGDNRPYKFMLEKGGLWAEALRRRSPLIVNDYQLGESLIKGYPRGQVKLTRIMIIPIIDGDKMVMMAVVGNKKKDYDRADAHQLELLLNGMWKIIQRKKVEEELRLSEERFSKAFKASPSLMMIYGFKDGRILDANTSFLEALGYTRKEVIGRTSLELNFWVQETDRERIRSKIVQQGFVRNKQIRFRAKSGEIRYGLYSAESIEINNKLHLLVLINDVTEHKKIESEMAQLDRMNLVGQMAAGIAHEIRNPMTAVRGFLQLLGTKEECSKYWSYFDLMIGEMDRANTIISEFLSVARNKPGKLEKENLNSTMKKIYPLIEANALQADKYVQLTLGEIPDLLINEKEIRQLVLNLAQNGLEAMSPGGKLSIKTFLQGKGVVLSVQDEGPGIDSEVLKKLGMPFFTTKDNGTGLGLAVCYGIAARHRATIEVETDATGTTFLVKFKSIYNE